MEKFTVYSYSVTGTFNGKDMLFKVYAKDATHARKIVKGSVPEFKFKYGRCCYRDCREELWTVCNYTEFDARPQLKSFWNKKYEMTYID